MDIKLRSFKNQKEYNYIWYGFLTLSLSGIGGAAAILSYSPNKAGIFLWLCIYACGGAALFSGFQLIKSLGQEKDDTFIDHFDTWCLGTPLLLLVVFNFFARFLYFGGWYRSIVYSSSESGWSFELLFILLNLSLLSIPIMAVNGWLFLIFVRHVKRQELRDNTLFKHWIPKCTAWYQNRRELYVEKYDFQKRMKRQMMFGILVLSCYIVFAIFALFSYEIYYMAGDIGTFIAILLIAGGFAGIFQYLSRQRTSTRMGIVLDGIRLIESGTAYKADSRLAKNPAFAEVSVQLDSIQRKLQTSVSEQQKSERMKVDLITNVSHDLKTPLTSIISYIDLLQKEEGLSEEAHDYLKILAQKSERLKAMVQDLFEISKATSGAIELDLEQLNMRKLLEQTLGDMEDQIQNSGLTIKKNFCEVECIFSGDGKRLYRVYQNLIENALKYSLEGTRIYIELRISEGYVVTIIKNIASYDMDFNDGDLTERFTRGDKARSSEGNGLGLSIAKSFSQMCGGDLNIEIDGDLFKVTVSFPMAA